MNFDPRFVHQSTEIRGGRQFSPSSLGNGGQGLSGRIRYLRLVLKSQQDEGIPPGGMPYLRPIKMGGFMLGPTTALKTN